MEIKCPYCHREQNIKDAAEDKKFCLQKGLDGKLHLNHSHGYHYQFQTQFIANVDNGVFCVCTFSESERPRILG